MNTGIGMYPIWLCNYLLVQKGAFRVPASDAIILRTSLAGVFVRGYHSAMSSNEITGTLNAL